MATRSIPPTVALAETASETATAVTTPSLMLYSPAGVLDKAAPLKLAAKRLRAWGFEVTIDPSATAKSQRFAGTDDERLAAIHRVADAAPSVALASRGGYGLTRLADRIDWALLKRSVERGTRWVGHSDVTVLQLGLLAHTGASSWAGPLACEHFGRADVAGGAADGATAGRVAGVDEITRDVFLEAMSGELEALGFRTGTKDHADGLDVKGTLWGGNLAMVTSLLGTPHMPKVKGGILFLEEIGEWSYRVERALLQLLQAGVLDAQKAIVLGEFTDIRVSRGYTWNMIVQYLRSATQTPILTGLPHGHVPMTLTLPIGRKAQLVVEGRDALIAWD